MSTPKNRPTRTPMYKQKTEVFSTREGYVRYRVNETPGRIEAFQLAGWDVVSSDENANLSDKGTQVPSQIGSVVRTVVNYRPDSPCTTGVLMEIPIELYEQDQLAKVNLIKEKTEALHPKNQGPDSYGSMSVG